jgi:nuclear GTP-binding protein
MAKKKEKAVNVSGKPRHSNDVNRPNDKKGAGGGAGGGSRSAATVRRLKMYKTRPKRDRSGKVLRNDFQSKELPNTRIEPDRRWFGESDLHRLASCLILIFERHYSDNIRLVGASIVRSNASL